MKTERQYKALQDSLDRAHTSLSKCHTLMWRALYTWCPNRDARLGLSAEDALELELDIENSRRKAAAERERIIAIVDERLHVTPHQGDK